MIGIVMTMFMAALDATIVGTAMPQLVVDLNGFDEYAAVTTAYLLSTTVVVPIVGKLSDLYGRKPFLLAGVLIFIVASALCGAAATMTQLIAFRALQGVGGGFAQAMAFTTIADLFPPSRRGRVSGMLGAVFGLASVIGPAVGGFLTDGPGWRWCFYVNVPIGLAAFTILLFGFPHLASRRRAHQIDWLGAVTLVLSMVPLLLALEWGGRRYAWTSPTVLVLGLFGVVMFAVFLAVESRAPEAIMPPSIFRHRVIGNAAAASMLTAVAMFGATLFIPLFIQSVIGTSAARSGAVLTPMMVTMVLASGFSGFYVSRRGRYKALAVLGVSAATLGLFLLSRADATYLSVTLSMVVLGAGLGVTLPIFPLAVQNAAEPSQAGVATATMHFVRSLGGSLGAAIFGAVLTNRYGAGLGASLETDALSHAPRELLASALHDVFLCATILVGLGVIFTLRLVDIPLRTTNRTAPADA